MSSPSNTPQGSGDPSEHHSHTTPSNVPSHPTSTDHGPRVPEYPELGFTGIKYPKWLKEHIHPNPASPKRNIYSYEFFTNEFRDQASARVKARGPFGKAGRPCKISINSYMVEQWPNKDVHQYDVRYIFSERAPHADMRKVLVGSGAEKRALVKVIWNTNAVKQAVGASFIFDGNRIGWYAVETSSLIKS